MVYGLLNRRKTQCSCNQATKSTNHMIKPSLALTFFRAFLVLKKDPFYYDDFYMSHEQIKKPLWQS